MAHLNFTTDLLINGTNGSEFGDRDHDGTSSSGSPDDPLTYVTLVLYIATFIAGVFGNGLVIYILLRFESVRSKSVANIYILNLSIADLVFIFTLPLFCYATYTKNWIFGNPMCKITYVFREINKFGSIFTLMALSVDRYLASFHTLARFRTNRVGKFVCLGVWIASFAMCTPYLVYSYSVDNGDKSVCKINWPTSHRLAHIKAWSYSQITFGLLAPLLVIVVSYILLMRRLKVIMKFRQTQRAKKPSRKMSRTILVVVIIFIICQLPYYVMDMLSVSKMQQIQTLAMQGKRYAPSATEWQLFVYCNALAQMLVFISSCCNPVIYGITNENFRELYRKALCCCRFNGKSAQYSLPATTTNG